MRATQQVVTEITSFLKEKKINPVVVIKLKHKEHSKTPLDAITKNFDK